MSALPGLPPLPAAYELTSSPRGACARHREWSALLEGAGYALDAEPAMRASALAGRRPLEELPTPRGTLLLRRFTHGGLLRSVTGSRFRDPARPFHELALSAALTELGIATPLVVGARARAAPGGGWHLDLLSLRVEGASDLESLLVELRRGAPRPAGFGPLLRGAGAFVRRLHDAGLVHVDLTPKNLLVDRRGAAARFLVLDLDRSFLVERLGPELRERNLRRLLRFVLRREARDARALKPRDYLAFLAGYEPDRRERRARARAIWSAHRRSLGWHQVGWGLERLFRR